MRTRLRLALLLQAAAIGAGAAGLLAVVGLPLAARGALGGGVFGVVIVLCAIVTFALSAALLLRWVGLPLARLLAAAERVGGGGGDLPLLGAMEDGSGPDLSRAAIAFERTAAALANERASLREKVAELERTNRDLAAAREDLLRSERLAAVGRLAAGIAHEVGNPLGAITGYAELARDKALAGAPAVQIADYLSRISTETHRIDLTVRELLDFARPARLELGPVRLDGILDAAVRLARVQERCRNVQVVADLPSDLPAALADPRRLAQVFLNLLLNAADAMGAGGEVRVTAHAEAGWIDVRVADGGPGVPADVFPRLFEPFFTTKPPGEGSGLGLAVCHGIMESFGGGIAAENGEGGAVFRLRLRSA